MSIPPPSGPHQPEGPNQSPRPPYGQEPLGLPAHPQGSYGPSAYQPWAQGYSPYNRPASVNGFAIASLALGVVCCVPGVGLVLGLVALRQIRRRGERGTGLAVGGSVLSGIGLALWALLLSTGSASDWEWFQQGARDGVTGSLVKGECFNAPDGELSGDTYGIDKVPCSGEHDGEVFASFSLEKGAYPGDDSVAGTADKRCYGLQDSYAMDTWAVPDDVDVYYLTPTELSWSGGDRKVICVFGNATEGRDLTGSLRKDETVLNAHQVAYLKAAHVLNAALESVPDTRYAEDDLPGHKAWAGRVSAALAEQRRLLRAHEWPAGAREPVAVLAGRLGKARERWAEAAKAPDVKTFYEYSGDGVRLIDPSQSITARKALGLDTTPPSDGGDTGSDDGDQGPGGGGGDVGMEV
ncbi:DUF4190 domain-containing protein [Streptomyces griseochromogenes]|uniref:DUF4190 domain-containing protein n=1 Tax=Streptomyces griseochromogenes TaxID=68214 RepID=UPI00379E41D1